MNLRREHPSSVFVLKNNRLEQARSLLLFFTLPFIICAFLGDFEAKNRKQFAFLGDSSEAIIHRYGDLLVIGRFDPQSGKLLADFRVLKADELKERIVMRRVEQVVPVDIKPEDIKAIHFSSHKGQEAAVPSATETRIVPTNPPKLPSPGSLTPATKKGGEPSRAEPKQGTEPQPTPARLDPA